MRGKNAKLLRRLAEKASVGVPDVKSHTQTARGNYTSTWATGSCKRLYRNLKAGKDLYLP